MGQVMNVEGCTALITGANRGLGRALAGMLVQRGARKVCAAARNPTAITDSRLTPVQLDVTAKDDIRKPDRFRHVDKRCKLRTMIGVHGREGPAGA